MVRHAAVEAIGAGPQIELAVHRLPRLRQRQRVDACSADAAEPEIVGILAEVPQLDDRGTRLDRLPRQRIAELLRDDLHPCGRGSGGDHRTSTVRWNDEAPGITRPASTWSHCSR